MPRIKKIINLKDKYKFRFLVDDAHGFGTLGKTGAGTGEEQDVQDNIDVYFATFAKSMASTGAFIAGDAEIIEYLKYNMRSQMFAKSLQMQLVVGALKRLELIKTKPEIKQKLWDNVHELQSGLKEKGFDNIPIFTTSIIDKKGCAYLGVGEVVAGPTGAAISNALCNALGQRIKTLPFTKDNITKELLN